MRCAATQPGVMWNAHWQGTLTITQEALGQHNHCWQTNHTIGHQDHNHALILNLVVPTFAALQGISPCRQFSSTADTSPVRSVCGVQAAKLLGCQPRVQILSVEADEAHIHIAKSTVKQGRRVLPQLPYSA